METFQGEITAERTVDVPDDLAQALADAKKPETRARRISKTLEMLK